jgi:prepilin-type N-terminal cleavage/methylation domain-containing protein
MEVGLTANRVLDLPFSVPSVSSCEVDRAQTSISNLLSPAPQARPFVLSIPGIPCDRPVKFRPAGDSLKTNENVSMRDRESFETRGTAGGRRAARSGRPRRAFTIMELLVVLAILAILASITLVVGRGVSERSRVTQARAEMAVLAAALEQYKQQYGDYPWTPGAPALPKTAEQDGGVAVEKEKNESKLFNALMGALGPKLTKIRGSDGKETLGRVFVEASRFSFENVDSSGAAVLPVIGTGASGEPEVAEVANAFLDPWERRYQYYYRSTADPTAWKSRGFALFSAGLNGVVEATPGADGFVTIPDSSDDLWEGR